MAYSHFGAGAVMLLSFQDAVMLALPYQFDGEQLIVVTPRDGWPPSLLDDLIAGMVNPFTSAIDQECRLAASRPNRPPLALRTQAREHESAGHGQQSQSEQVSHVAAMLSPNAMSARSRIKKLEEAGEWVGNKVKGWRATGSVGVGVGARGWYLWR